MKESWRAMIVYICPLTSKKTPIFPTFNSCPYKLWSELFHVIASYHNDTPRRTFAEKRTPPPFYLLCRGDVKLGQGQFRRMGEVDSQERPGVRCRLLIVSRFSYEPRTTSPFALSVP
jgi:hypothetical protein